MKMRTLITSLALMLALLFPVLGTGQVSAGSAWGHNQYTCALNSNVTNQPTYRVCIDPTTSYGPTLYVYADSSNKNYYTHRAAVYGGFDVPAFRGVESDTAVFLNTVETYNVPTVGQVTLSPTGSFNESTWFTILDGPYDVYNSQTVPNSADEIFQVIRSLFENDTTYVIEFWVVN